MSAARQGGGSQNDLDHSANSSAGIPARNPPLVDPTWPRSLFPTGHRFKPSDEVLVGDYLSSKIDGHRPPPFILEFDVFGTEPWNFPGDAEEERYFFCRIKKEVKSGGSSAGVRKRVVGASGYWKLTGTEKQIITLPLKAIKSRFLFCDGGGEDQEEEEDDDDEEGGGGGSTNVAQAEPKWIMHEFRPQYQGNQIERDQWAAYRVFQKKPKGPKGRVICLRSSSQRLLNRLYDRA